MLAPVFAFSKPHRLSNVVEQLFGVCMKSAKGSHKFLHRLGSATMFCASLRDACAPLESLGARRATAMQPASSPASHRPLSARAAMSGPRSAEGSAVLHGVLCWVFHDRCRPPCAAP